MKVKRNVLGYYQIQVDDDERESLDHLAELSDQSTDNLLVSVFSTAIHLIVLASQVKRAYDKINI